MEIIYAIAGFFGGGLLSYFLWDKALKSKKRKIISEAEAEGEVIKKDKILQAKRKIPSVKSDHEKFINERNSKISSIENKLKQQERP
jgi:ribonuclease Y